MSTKSKELREGIGAWLAWRTTGDEDKYEAYSRHLDGLSARYGRDRVRATYRRYRGAVTILIKDGVIYRRL
jgi:hypothetical protein